MKKLLSAVLISFMVALIFPANAPAPVFCGDGVLTPSAGEECDPGPPQKGYPIPDLTCPGECGEDCTCPEPVECPDCISEYSLCPDCICECAPCPDCVCHNTTPSECPKCPDVTMPGCPEITCPEFPDDREAAFRMGFYIGWWTGVAARDAIR
jgi:hypothetical protein